MAPCYATSDATRAHADRHAPPPAAPGQPALGGLDGARDRWGAGGRARPRRRRDGRVARRELRRRALHSRARGGGDGGRRDGGCSGDPPRLRPDPARSEEHTSELQSPCNLVCRLLLEKKKKKTNMTNLAYFFSVRLRSITIP